MFLCLYKEGEKKGLSPEEVYTSIKVSGDTSILPCKWLKAELPRLLDQVRMLVSASSLQSVSGKTTTDETVSMLHLISAKAFLSLTAHTNCFPALFFKVLNFSLSAGHVKPLLRKVRKRLTLHNQTVCFSCQEQRPSRLCW